MAFKTDNWIGTTSSDWGVAANWSGGLPNSNSNVVINTANVLTVTFSGGDNYVVNSLKVGNDFFDMNGGSLTITTTASFADDFTQTGGVLTAGGAVTIAGAGTLTGGSSEGHTAFTISGTIALANYTLGGATVLNNAHTTNETGGIALGDNTGVGATINNEKGATFNIGGDYGISQGAATARFVNAGTLAKIGGSGISFIDVNVTDTGAIVINSGTLDFRGPDNTFKGTISGAGQFALDDMNGSGTDLIAAGTKITTATFGIYDNGTAVTLGENLNYAGIFNIEQGSTLDLAGFTFTLSGTNTFGIATFPFPTVDGAGTLVTTKSSATAVNDFILGGTVDWQNSGVVGDVGGLTLGDGSFNAATFINEKGGVFEFTTDNGIVRGAALNSSFVNAAGATLEKIGGGGDSIVAVNMIDNGAIKIQTTGTIEFEGIYNTFAGAISGAGQFALGAGSNNVIAAGATIASATFGIYDNNTLVTLDETLSYAGTFNLEEGSTLDLNGVTLTLSGTNTLSSNNSGVQPVIDGTGTLVTAHGSTTTVSLFTLGGAVDWQNSGTVNQLNTLTIGDGTFNAATFINEKGGVYDLLNDSGIGIGVVTTSKFINDAGATFEKTGSTGGDSTVAVAFTNSGTVEVAAGTLEFQNTVAGNGKFIVEPGAVLRFDMSVAGGSVDFATHTGGELLLADSQQFRAGVHGFGGASTDEMDLRDINFTSSAFKLSYNGNTTQGVLTVTDGTHTAHLTMFGNYTKANFLASADSAGGTLIVDPATHAILLASGH